MPNSVHKIHLRSLIKCRWDTSRGQWSGPVLKWNGWLTALEAINWDCIRLMACRCSFTNKCLLYANNKTFIHVAGPWKYDLEVYEQQVWGQPIFTTCCLWSATKTCPVINTNTTIYHTQTSTQTERQVDYPTSPIPHVCCIKFMHTMQKKIDQEAELNVAWTSIQ